MADSLDEVNALIGAGMSFAPRMLAGDGALFPFAAVMRPTGEPEILFLQTDPVEPEWLITSVRLWRQLQAEVAGGAATAVACFSESRTSTQATQAVERAVQIEIESTKLDPILCSVPFTLTESEPSFGALAHEPGYQVLIPHVPPSLSGLPEGLRMTTGRSGLDRFPQFQAVCDAVRNRIASNDFHGALGVAQAAVDMTMRMLGPDHPQLAIALRNLGIVYRELTQHHRAAAAYRIAVEIAARSPGVGSERHARYSEELQECEQRAVSLVAPTMRIGRHLLSGELPEAYECAQTVLQRVVARSDGSQDISVQLSETAREGLVSTSFALLGLRHGGRITPENPEKFDNVLAHVQTLIATRNAPVPRAALACYLVMLIRYCGEIVPEGSTEELTQDWLRKAAALADGFQAALTSMAGTAAESGTQVLVCPHCHVRVQLSADGICPSCRKSARSAPDGATHAPPSLSSGMPADRQATEKPWWKVW